MKDNLLNLFFGRQPSDDFLEDLEALKKLSEREIFGLIDKIIEWYPKENIDKEFDEWEKEFTKEEIQERKRAIRILLFVFKEFVSGNINEDELKDDFEIIKLPQRYFNHFLKMLKPVEKEFRKNSLEGEKPYENALISIDWRIDAKHYRDGTENKIAFLELILFDRGEEKVVQFDLNSKALKHLIYRLKKIEEEL